jgi:hypothetical protein
VLDAASVKIERAVAVTQRRLMRHEDVDAFRKPRTPPRARSVFS